MSAIVDYGFYSTVYMGTEADEVSFPALCARAEDIVGAITHWAHISKAPEIVRTLYQKAICAQVDFFAVNGLDCVNISAGADNGFTVGKVSVHGRSGGALAKAGSMSGNIAPMALAYLEQTGLMNPAVDAVDVAPDFWGW